VSESDRRALWLRGLLDLCVLAVLRGGERYGYELAQLLEQCGLGQIKGGTLYPVLGRLADSGFLVAHWREGDGGPGRKYYALTQEGLAFLDRQSDLWRGFDQAVHAVLSPNGGTS